MLRYLSPYKIIVAVWLIVLAILFRPEVHGNDPVGYYAWLRSVAIQGSLEMSDEFQHYDRPQHHDMASPITGYFLNYWPVGSAVLWAPFFALGQLAVWLGQALGLYIAPDGYSKPYIIAVALGSATYALLGLFLIYDMCRSYARRHEAIWGVLSGWLASPLIFYMSGHPIMSHANDFFINALYLRTWAYDARPTWRSRFVLGLLGGLAACVRPQNVTLLVVTSVDEMARKLREPLSETPATIARLVTLTIGALVGFAPQMIAWRIVFGHWIVFNPYEVGGGSIEFPAAHFFDVLFSTNRGLFLWSPITLFALWGLIRYLPRYQLRWALFLTGNFILQLYIIGSWWAWSGAVAFGQRFLVNSVPAFCLGLAAVYTSSLFRRGKAIPAIFSTGFIGWNLILLARYGLQDIARAGFVSLEDLWLGQFAFLFRFSQHVGDVLRDLSRQVS